MKLTKKNNKYLQKYPEEKQNEVFNLALRIGFTAIESGKKVYVSKSESKYDKIFSGVVNKFDTFISDKISEKTDLIDDVITKITEKMDRYIFDKIEQNSKEKEKYDKILSDTISELNSFITEKMSEISSSLKNPAIKGAVFEDTTKTILKSLFPSYKIELTAKRKESGDIHIILPDDNIIVIELKSYKNKVPTKEIMKFYRDIESVEKCIGGIMISENSFIMSKKIIDFEIYKGFPLFFMADTPISARNVIKGMIETIKIFSEQVSEDVKSTSKNEDVIKKYIEFMNVNKKLLVNIKKNVSEVSKNINEMIRLMKNDLKK